MDLPAFRRHTLCWFMKVSLVSCEVRFSIPEAQTRCANMCFRPSLVGADGVL